MEIFDTPQNTDEHPNATHGMRYTIEYETWHGIKARCLCQSNKDYSRYGGRGIRICERWLSFDNFFADMGEKPPGLSLDRKDNDGNYEPSNCRWATPVDQASNRRNSRWWFIKGQTFVSAQVAADFYGVSDVTIHNWAKGYTDRRSNITYPARKDCYVIPKY